MIFFQGIFFVIPCVDSYTKVWLDLLEIFCKINLLFLYRLTWGYSLLMCPLKRLEFQIFLLSPQMFIKPCATISPNPSLNVTTVASNRFNIINATQVNSHKQTNATTQCINYNSVPKHSCFHEYMTRTIEKLCFSFQILTKDSVTVFVDAIMYYKVVLMNRKYAGFFVSF